MGSVFESEAVKAYQKTPQAAKQGTAGMAKTYGKRHYEYVSTKSKSAR